MNRNTLILLFCLGVIVSIIGFVLAQYVLTLIVIAFLVLAFVYSDIKKWYDSKDKDL